MIPTSASSQHFSFIIAFSHPRRANPKALLPSYLHVLVSPSIPFCQMYLGSILRACPRSLLSTSSHSCLQHLSSSEVVTFKTLKTSDTQTHYRSFTIAELLSNLGDALWLLLLENILGENGHRLLSIFRGVSFWGLTRGKD